MPLKIRADGAAFRATGESAVKLSDYGIEQPSQFGVKTADEIQLHIEFSAKEGAAKIASGGRPMMRSRVLLVFLACVVCRGRCRRCPR